MTTEPNIDFDWHAPLSELTLAQWHHLSKGMENHSDCELVPGQHGYWVARMDGKAQVFMPNTKTAMDCWNVAKNLLKK